MTRTSDKPKSLITNYHALQLRERVAAGKITKSILADGQSSPFTETPGQDVAMVFDPGKIPNRPACWLRGEKDAAGTRG